MEHIPNSKKLKYIVVAIKECTFYIALNCPGF
jgi:hypothetical protein